MSLCDIKNLRAITAYHSRAQLCAQIEVLKSYRAALNFMINTIPLDVAKRHQKFARYRRISLSRPIMRANRGSEILSGSFVFRKCILSKIQTIFAPTPLRGRYPIILFIPDRDPSPTPSRCVSVTPRI